MQRDFCEDDEPVDELLRIEKIEEALAGMVAAVWSRDFEGTVTPSTLLRIRRGDEPAP